MAGTMTHCVRITEVNPDIASLKLNWGRPEFTADDGIDSLDSLYQASDSIVAIAGFFDDKLVAIGSGVMIGPGVMLTATHVLDEFPRTGSGPVLLTFIPGGVARAWLPTDVVTASGPSQFQNIGEKRKKVSDLTLLSCALHSEAHTSHPISLVPIELRLPQPGERLWAVGFRHGTIEENVSGLIPLVTSGIVTECFVHGRGERLASPCIEVDMEALGGMSGGPVFNKDGLVVGIVSSSFDGGPTYVTLVWDAMRLSVKSPQQAFWPSTTLSLFEGVELGLVRIKAKVKKDNDWNVTLTLSEEEMNVIDSQSEMTKIGS